MGGEKKWECRGRLHMRQITISLWKSLCLVRPSEVAWNFLKNDFMPALYSARQIPLSERCKWVSWEVKMLSHHFVFVLSPDVKSIHYFVWGEKSGAHQAQNLPFFKKKKVRLAYWEKVLMPFLVIPVCCIFTLSAEFRNTSNCNIGRFPEKIGFLSETRKYYLHYHFPRIKS